MVISVTLHGIILLLVLSWGVVNAPEYSKEIMPIEGRLVTFEELKKPAVEDLKPAEVIKPEKQAKKVDAGRIEPKKEATEIPEKKKQEPKKAETKKVEKKREPEKKVEIIEKKKEDKVALKQEKKKVKKKAEKPKSTKAPVKKTAKKAAKKEQKSSSQLKSIVDEIKRDVIIKSIKKEQKQTELAMSENGSGTEIETPIDTKKISSRTSVRGGGRAVNPVIVNLFKERIYNEIRPNFNIPPNITIDKRLEALIFFKIDENGRVLEVSVKETSGDLAFDDFCVKAIHKSAPLTPPPPELIDQAKYEGFLLPFSNEQF